MTTTMTTRLRAMLRWIAGGLAVLATCAAAGGAGVQITITVDGQQQVFQQDGSAAAGGLMQYEGEASGSGWTAEWDFSNNADVAASDAQVSGSATFVNSSNQPKDVHFVLTMPMCPIVQNSTTMGGICSVLMTANSGGGSVTCGPANSIFAALVDGQPAALLFNCPFALNAGGNSTTSTSANFGAPIPSLAGPAIGDSIGVRFAMTLSAGDTTVVGTYYVVAADEGNMVACPPQIDLSEAATYAGGTDLRSVAIADLDDDGSPDVLTSDSGSNQLAALLNSGGGSLALDETASTGAFPVSVAAGDLDADGFPDAVVANRDDKSVSFYRNDGTGSLVHEGEIIVGKKPSSVALADLDNDGDLDLAVALKGVNKVGVYLNAGSPLTPLPASFVLSVKYSVGAAPACVIAADVTGDGLGDLVVACPGDPTLTILPGIGSGLFGASTTAQVGAGAKSVIAGDFDGDGSADLAAIRSGADKLKILLNNGNGTFTGQPAYTTGDGPTAAIAADFDGDGDLDIIVGNAQSDSLSIFENLGAGSLAPAVSFNVPSGPTSIACEDLDGDGYSDLVTASGGSGGVAVMINQSQ